MNSTSEAEYANGSLILGNTGAEFSQNGDGDYLDLPNGIISALNKNATFETWTTCKSTIARLVAADA